MGKISDKAWKMIKMVSLIEGKHSQYSRQDIQRILGIKKNSFYRYKNCLEEAGVPIYYNRKLKAYKIRKDYYLRQPHLSLSEILALVASSNSILNDSELPYYEEINTSLAKITASLPDKVQAVLEPLKSRIHFSLNSLVDYSESREIHALLEDAIQEESNVWIKYYSYKRDKASERVVSPYILDFKKGFLYLIAYCHNKNETRMFRVDRIKDSKVTEDKFKYPDDFSLKKYMGNSWSVMRGDKDVKVKVKFTGDIARWIKENKYHPTQEVEELEYDSIIMSFTTSGLSEVKGWILKYGSSAEVLEPESLREEIKDEIKGMMGVYK
ncbi:helix-turn-helix transcriptional regulator [Orenia marismortui]|uniref:Putative DNA-binding transcriptional regulator YafY n=1 Tax=Orenia marismortui TaxID=46469 RepID=A0A4R8HHY2_9FIRM|nr:WYL domain-containing protein [Orenia marismortui]TDX59018.1 putative DNA-binding transcriptional regulator YafY [Orenia marismortui]